MRRRLPILFVVPFLVPAVSAQDSTVQLDAESAGVVELRQEAAEWRQRYESQRQMVAQLQAQMSAMHAEAQAPGGYQDALMRIANLEKALKERDELIELLRRKIALLEADLGPN